MKPRNRSLLPSILLLSFFFLMGTAAALWAENGQDAVSWQTRELRLYSSVRAGDVVLPAGIYAVRHLMEGEKHIMVFKTIGKGNKEFRVTCTMLPLAERAARTEQEYRYGAGGERILLSLVFEGDNVKHVF